LISLHLVQLCIDRNVSFSTAVLSSCLPRGFWSFLKLKQNFPERNRVAVILIDPNLYLFLYLYLSIYNATELL